MLAEIETFRKAAPRTEGGRDDNGRSVAVGGPGHAALAGPDAARAGTGRRPPGRADAGGEGRATRQPLGRQPHGRGDRESSGGAHAGRVRGTRERAAGGG